MKRLLITALLSLLLLGITPRSAAGLARERVAATRISEPIRVDGILDEAAWQDAAPISAFRLIFVAEGAQPSESTAVRVLFDDQHVYFGIWCGNRNPGAVRASLAPRDEALDDDQIVVHLDTYPDFRRAYVFGVNAEGVQLDGILDGDEPDFTWDAVWDSEVLRAADGWTSEIAIPLRAMRFPAGGPGVWGLWMRRQITKNDEVCSWPLWRQSVQGDIMLQGADLAGLDGLRGGGGLEAQPYVTSIRSETRGFSGSGALSPWDASARDAAGLDLEYAITTTLSANATLNPDYSQVEADALQIDVNQRFPLYYPEKRPFFIEGAEIFSSPLDLVYTRRIADPAAGVKLTGKTGRVRVGAIAVRDDGGGSLEGVGAALGDGASGRGFVGIGRVTADLGENSSVGLLVADRGTDAPGWGARPAVVLPGALPAGRRNTVVAGDTRIRFGRTLSFTGQLAGSITQVDSVREYDNPAYVPRRATLTDLAYDARLAFADGVRELELYQRYLGPDFRAETGFLDRVDVRQTGFDSDFIARPENAWLRSWQPILNGYAIHDHTGGLQEWYLSPMIDWQFQKQTHVHTMFVRSMERWLARDYDLNTYILSVDNTLWRPLALSFSMSVGEGIFYGGTDAESFRGWAERYSLAATLRPSPRLTSELSATRRRFAPGFGDGEIFDIWVWGAKTTYQFTRRLYARVYPQYDAGREHLDADALLGYVVSPGTVFYLGVGGGLDRMEGRHRATQRSVFVKASYLFQR